MAQRKLTPFRRKYLSFQTSEKRRKIKLEALKYKGGKCIRCGYDKCPGALVFHHPDPNKKDFAISEKGISYQSLEKIKPELDKCLLVCSNCHSEIHAEEHEKIRLIKFEEISLEKRKFDSSVDKKCFQCNKDITVFASQVSKRNFCSRKCSNECLYNEGWIKDEELLLMREMMDVKQIASLLNKNWRLVYKRLSKIRKRGKFNASV